MNKKEVLVSLYRLYSLDINEFLVAQTFRNDFNNIEMDTAPIFLKENVSGHPVVNINTQAPGAYVLHKFLECTECPEYSKEETVLLLTLALNRDPSDMENELANDITEVCLFLDCDELGTLSELIYSICDKNVWRYHFDRFLPVQLCLYHIFGTEEEKTSFWQETYYIADTYRAFVNITAKRFQPK